MLQVSSLDMRPQFSHGPLRAHARSQPTSDLLFAFCTPAPLPARATGGRMEQIPHNRKTSLISRFTFWMRRRSTTPGEGLTPVSPLNDAYLVLEAPQSARSARGSIPPHGAP
eukprot:5283940-Prymnesium_polylepis.1